MASEAVAAGLSGRDGSGGGRIPQLMMMTSAVPIAASTSSGCMVVTRAYIMRMPPTARCGSLGGFFRLPMRHNGLVRST